MFSFAARRLGQIAAAAPAREASSTTITRLSTGMLNSVMPWLPMASTSAQPKNTPISRPRTVPCRAMITDSQRIIARNWCLVIPTARMTPSSRVRSKIDRARVLPMPSRAIRMASASRA